MNITIGELIGNFILVAGSFLLLIVLIKKFAWDNITSIFEERAKKISDDIDSAESARKNAEVLEQKREEALAGSREEAATIVEEVSRLKQKANQEIAQSKAEALRSIKGDVADLSIDLASKIIGQTLDKEAQSQLIDSYIDKLGDA